MLPKPFKKEERVFQGPSISEDRRLRDGWTSWHAWPWWWRLRGIVTQSVTHGGGRSRRYIFLENQRALGHSPMKWCVQGLSGTDNGIRRLIPRFDSRGSVERRNLRFPMYREKRGEEWGGRGMPFAFKALRLRRFRFTLSWDAALRRPPFGRATDPRLASRSRWPARDTEATTPAESGYRSNRLRTCHGVLVESRPRYQPGRA
jgi:hypothetical protein